MPSPSLGSEEGDMALPWGSKEGEGLEGGRTIAIPHWVERCLGEERYAPP